MNNNITVLKGALVGGLIFFIWTNISWMAIGWHNSYISQSPNEDSFAQAIQTEIQESGLYLIPYHDGSDPEAAMAKMEQGPFAYMMIHPNGKESNMGVFMIRSLIMNFLMAGLATWLLLQTTGLSLVKRALFVGVVGLAGGAWPSFAFWNWWGFPMQYFIVHAMDTALGWTVTGFAIAKFVTKD